MKGIIGLAIILLVMVFVVEHYLKKEKNNSINTKTEIRIYSKKEIEILRQGGKILAKIMKELKKEVKPGITTEHLNELVEKLIDSSGAEKEYIFCTSINEEIAHVFPGKRILKTGDILSLDLVIKFKGYHTDMAVTVPVGKIDKKTNRLLKVTKKALELGIKQAKPGNHIGDIGYAIQKYVEKNGFNVIKGLRGHGIGKNVHEKPFIPNYGKPSTGLKLKKGMVLAIEPLIAMGNGQMQKTKDGRHWKTPYKTQDNSLSCHFEHTIVITKKGPKILTKI